MKEQIEFPLKNIRRFFIFQGIFGPISIYGFLMLPASESDRAIWMGLSLFRLLIIIFSLALVIFLIIMIFYSFLAVLKLENVWGKIVIYIENHSLLLTSLMASSFMVSVGFLTLELLINTALFPNSVYYKFLYDRIRPMSIWGLVFCSHLVLFIYKQLWIKYPIQGRQQITLNKREKLSFILIMISWAGMIILWLRYAVSGNNFVNYHLMNTTLVLTSLILLVVPIYLNHDSKN